MDLFPACIVGFTGASRYDDLKVKFDEAAVGYGGLHQVSAFFNGLPT
eukprot:COSAG02_NODE_609_length_19574_cov_18.178537_20_plen_47_part_00